MKTPITAELLESAKRGNQEAFNIIVKVVHDCIRRILPTEDEDQIRDLAQIALEHVFKYADLADSPHARIMIAAHQIALNHRRRRITRREVPLDDVPSHRLSMPEQEYSPDDMTLVRGIIGRLSTKRIETRNIFFRHLMGYTPHEIAAELKIDVDKVYRRIDIARRFLQASPRNSIDLREIFESALQLAQQQICAIVVGDGSAPIEFTKLAQAVNEFAGLLGLELLFDEPPVHGSWLKRFWLRMKKAATSEEIKNGLRAAEDGIRAHGVDKPKAEATKHYAESIERIMNSVGKGEGGRVAFFMETLLVIKYQGPDGQPVLICKQLTREEQDIINRNQELMVSPEKLLQCLSRLLAPTGANSGTSPRRTDDSAPKLEPRGKSHPAIGASSIETQDRECRLEDESPPSSVP